MNFNPQQSVFRPFLAAAVIASATLFACDDEKVTPILSEANAETETAEISVPRGSTVYYDFKTNSVKDSAQSMISLSGMYGSSLENSRVGTYTMAYFDKEDTSVEDLTLNEILSTEITETEYFSIDASSAGEPATGPTWIIYDFLNGHAVYPTEDRYIVIFKGAAFNENAEELYVLQAKSITAAQGTGTYSIDVKKYTRQ